MGEQDTLENCTSKIFRKKGPLEPKMVSLFIKALKPSRTSLVMVDLKAPPERLVKDFWSATGLGPVPDDVLEAANVKRNVSIRYAEIEVLRVANKYSGDNGVIRWLFLENLFKDEVWKNNIVDAPLPIPQKTKLAAARASSIMIADVKNISATHPIEITGDLQFLAISGY
ncbi:hypothetical protein [Nitrospirillum sp. BR 11828]|uniref:hypothetical protein n=1 Tax=Nitrospirillum sp. BR 11828 TaxID=3104325 RepID=UPI002ACA0D16|nr:hypothetical protein [Nitrospirillum sp. BR 11828]MDZ5645629.1 hypothetical protein [Nitrospirillum sp. BR 11828]